MIEEIDLPEELAKHGIDDNRFDQFDFISEISFFFGEKSTALNAAAAPLKIKINIEKKKKPHIIEIEPIAGKITMKKVDKYEDKSVFKYGLTYVAQHEPLLKFIQEESQKGNLITFPLHEF